ncbi:MAG: hypothetical protein OXI80_14265 [Caldilineaceae bacterium]|nr:hypothetical protein [Caldilineaceae bacterium]MDE0338831.1 hypothetical protein [Caldilineaceae bacterium]
MNDADFVAWVDDHVRSDKRLPACKRAGDTVELIEKDRNVDMTLRIEEVPESVVIIRPDAASGWDLFCGNKPKNFKKRCDYLLVGKTDGGYFAVFVELKKTLPHKNDTRHEENGYAQLRWSQPLFDYLLSVFNTDSCSDLIRSEFSIKYWRIGEKPFGDHVKSPVYLGEDEDVRFAGRYKGLTIHNRVTPFISLRDLLES